MALNIEVSSSDWIDLRARGFVSGMYLVNQVGAPIEYSTAATPVPGTTLVGSSAVLISGTYLWVRGAGDCELYTASEWSAANVKTVPVMASTYSAGGGVEFDAATQDAIIAIAGDASASGSAAQIVDGYPVEVTGTSEVLVSAVPCDVIWIAHNGVTGTITVRDAGVTGTGIAAVKTIDMAATSTLQPGSLRTQFGVTATLTAGKATLWVRPL